jgi:hypothetical protein
MNITTNGNRALDGLDIGLLHEDFPSLSFQSLMYTRIKEKRVFVGIPAVLFINVYPAKREDGSAEFGTEKDTKGEQELIISTRLQQNSTEFQYQSKKETRKDERIRIGGRWMSMRYGAGVHRERSGLSVYAVSYAADVGRSVYPNQLEMRCRHLKAGLSRQASCNAVLERSSCIPVSPF